jgi:hypothetical protein
MRSTIISSQGIFSICDHHAGNILSDASTKLPNTYPSKYGESVYIQLNMLNLFILQYLSNITIPFVLVTGDSDITIPSDIEDISSQILNNKFLLCWYTQNCIEPSDKLKQIPIGLDFHTLENNNNISWGEQRSVNEQEDDIFKIITHFEKEKVPKINICYANFHFSMKFRYCYDRIDAINSIPKECVFYENTNLKRIDSWNQMIKYRFIISPHGNGLDCHRTWEALALGCYPIIKSSPLDCMFEGLPVIIVNNWNEVTPDFLDKYKNLPTFIPYPEKMFMKYWNTYIHQFKK